MKAKRPSAGNSPGKSTLVIFGGVTEKGFETAQSTATASAGTGQRTIWYNGWVDPDSPLSQTENQFEVINYSKEEAERFSNRLETKLRDVSLRIGGLANPANPFNELSDGRTLTRGKYGFVARLAGWLDRRVVKRWNTATTGYLSWRLIRSDVKSRAAEVDVDRIIYCDDFAATAAWHSARIWTDAVVSRAEFL